MKKSEKIKKEFELIWLAEIMTQYKTKKVGEYITIFDTAYGHIDYYPRIDRAMIVRTSQWVKPGLEWIIKYLLRSNVAENETHT